MGIHTHIRPRSAGSKTGEATVLLKIARIHELQDDPSFSRGAAANLSAEVFPAKVFQGLLLRGRPLVSRDFAPSEVRFFDQTLVPKRRPRRTGGWAFAGLRL